MTHYSPVPVHVFVEYLNKMVDINDIINKYQGSYYGTDNSVNKSRFSALKTAVCNIRQAQINLNLSLESTKRKQSEALYTVERLLAQGNNVDESEVNLIAKQNEDFIKILAELQIIRAKQHEELQLLLAECD